MNDCYKILSIDGGGIKGIFPATILSAIENSIDGNICDYFDLITGTSTGGLIALSLALGKPAEDIKNLYINKGNIIFKKDLFSFSLGILRHKYSSNNLKKELISFFGENTILDDCKTRVCIPSSNVTNFSTTVFKTRHHSDYKIDYKLPVWQIGMSTTGAPSYFPAFTFNHELKKGLFVDGGLWANNPSLVGATEAKKLGYALEKIKILSIGTGKMKIFKKRKRLKYFGLMGWGTDLVEYVFHVQSLGVENTLNYLGLDCVRINTEIDSKTKLDNVKIVADLEAMALQKYQETVNEIHEKFFNEKTSPYERAEMNLS